MRKAAEILLKLAAVIGLTALTIGASANPDPARTGPANDGGTSGYNDTSGNSGTGSGSGCSK